MNPAWLHTFKTLVDIGHFTKTAEALFMTQPGVSQHVKKLEQATGYDLIKRSNKQFHLTEQGRLVYQYAQQVADNQKQLLESLGFDDDFAGLCSLSCSGSLAMSAYPKLIELQQQYPDLSFHIEVSPNDRILHDVQQGRIDLGVVTHLPNSHLFNSQVIGEEPLCLVLPKAYESQTINAQTLLDLGMVKHPDAVHYLSLYLAQCDEPGWDQIQINQIRPASYINQLSQILLPIAHGIGFTVLPYSAVAYFPLNDKLHVHQTKRAVTEPLYLISQRYRQLPKRYETIKSLILEKLCQPQR